MNITEIPSEERYGYDIISDGNYSKFSPRQSTDEVFITTTGSHWMPTAPHFSGSFIVGQTYRRKVQVPVGHRLVGLHETIQSGDLGMYLSTSAPLSISRIYWGQKPEMGGSQLVAVFRPLVITEPVIPAGYRKVARGEEILPKDRPLSMNGVILDPIPAWIGSSYPISGELNTISCWIRPVEQTVGTCCVAPKDELDGWIRTDDRLPKAEEYPVWVWDGVEMDWAAGPYPSDASINLINRPSSVIHGFLYDTAVTHWHHKPKEVKPAPPKPKEKPEDVAFESTWLENLQDVNEEAKGLRRGVIATPRAKERHRKTFNAGRAFGQQERKV